MYSEKDYYSLEMSLNNRPCDKLHLKALKYIIGVNKKATNDAVLAETGRHPLYIDILRHSVKNYQRLSGPDCPNLLS